jgi:hypothetical protein
MPAGTPECEGIPDGHDQPLYPLWTSVMSHPIGGSAWALLVSFQALIIIWALVLALGYLITACMTTPDLLGLGTRAVNSPVELCDMIKRSAVVMLDTRYGKMGFLGFAYGFTFIWSFFISISQARQYEWQKAQHDTLKDFTACCEGLPLIQGTEPLEDQLKVWFETKVSRPIVGVSVCWDYWDNREAVMAAIEQDLEELELGSNPSTWQRRRPLQRSLIHSANSS